jgi:hypothetical protein
MLELLVIFGWPFLVVSIFFMFSWIGNSDHEVLVFFYDTLEGLGGVLLTFFTAISIFSPVSEIASPDHTRLLELSKLQVLFWALVSWGSAGSFLLTGRIAKILTVSWKRISGWIHQKWKCFQTIRKAKQQQDTAHILKRCEESVKRAIDCFPLDADTVAFRTATRQILNKLKVALAQYKRTESLLAISGDPDASLQNANRIFGDVDISVHLGAFPERLKADRKRMEAGLVQLKALIQGIVYVCDNLPVAVTTALLQSDQDTVAHLHSSVKEVFERLNLVTSFPREETALYGLETGTVFDQLLRSTMGEVVEAEPERCEAPRLKAVSE